MTDLVEIDEAGRRDLNAALDAFVFDYNPSAVMAGSPMGNFIAGFYAARGWVPRKRVVDIGPSSYKA